MEGSRRIDIDQIIELVRFRARASACFTFFLWAQAAVVLALPGGSGEVRLSRIVAALALALTGTVSARLDPAGGRGRLVVSLTFTALALLIADCTRGFALAASHTYVISVLSCVAAYCDRRAIVAAGLLALVGEHAGFAAFALDAAVVALGCGALLWIVANVRGLFQTIELQRRNLAHVHATAEETARWLELHAYRDALTGCRNRPFFSDRLATDLVRANGRGDFRFAVLFFDLDDFKYVNDTYGHRVGDLLLIEFARRIEQAIRPQDTLARMGGDEFVALVEDIADIAEADLVGKRIAASLNRPFVLEGWELKLSASIGVADSCDGYATAEAMIREADAAMYRAKRSRSVLAPSIVSAAKHRAAALARRGRSQQTNAPILIEAIR